MAMIECPECGRKVSSMAKVCPDCGYPIAENSPIGEVKIKISLDSYLLAVIIYDAKTMKELWRGKSGNLAVLNVDGPTDIIIKGRSGKTQATVKAGEKYELSSQNGFFVNKDVLNRVDVIDSGR